MVRSLKPNKWRILASPWLVETIGCSRFLCYPRLDIKASHHNVEFTPTPLPRVSNPPPTNQGPDREQAHRKSYTTTHSPSLPPHHHNRIFVNPEPTDLKSPIPKPLHIPWAGKAAPLTSKVPLQRTQNSHCHTVRTSTSKRSLPHCNHSLDLLARSSEHGWRNYFPKCTSVPESEPRECEQVAEA
jgi:hypothetical protein